MNPRLKINTATWLALALAHVYAHAQMHKVTKPENVVRAVGVYEWTGDLKKPAASRLVPVSLFIDGKLEDAGEYKARPVPFALETGTIFELDEAGVPKGLVQLSFARHLLATNAKGDATPYEDGWFGYGAYQPMPVPKPPAKKERESHSVVAVNGVSDDPDRPVLLRKSGSEGDSGSSDTASSSDPNRPKLARKSDSTSDESSNPAPPTDPDRPILKKKPAGSDADATPPDPSMSVPSDPDRPTLKKHSGTSAVDAGALDDGYGFGDPSLNDDPNRPTLHRGKPVSAMTEDDLPKLTGLPPDLHQMVAVSDSKNRPQHDFARQWESETERTTILAKMQDLARAKVLAYSGNAPAAPAKTSPAPTTLAVRRKAALDAKKAADAEASVTFADEDLRGYLLSYGGTPTYVYTASAGPDKNGAVRYVSIVAQADGVGELNVAMSSVTDALHLDRTPRFRLVGVVDAEASNRASLLVELRAQNSRQFALYRVIGAHSDQIFSTGTTQ